MSGQRVKKLQSQRLRQTRLETSIYVCGTKDGPVQTPSPQIPEGGSAGSLRKLGWAPRATPPRHPWASQGEGAPRMGAAWSPALTGCRAQASPAVPGRQGRCYRTQYGSPRAPYGGRPGRGAGRGRTQHPQPCSLPPPLPGSSLGGSWRMGWPESQVLGWCPPCDLRGPVPSPKKGSREGRQRTDSTPGPLILPDG